MKTRKLICIISLQHFFWIIHRLFTFENEVNEMSIIWHFYCNVSNIAYACVAIDIACKIIKNFVSCRWTVLKNNLDGVSLLMQLFPIENFRIFYTQSEWFVTVHVVNVKRLYYFWWRRTHELKWIRKTIKIKTKKHSIITQQKYQPMIGTHGLNKYRSKITTIMIILMTVPLMVNFYSAFLKIK